MKTTGRDIWAIPPGGFAAKPRRAWLKPAIASALVLSLGVGGGALYASMKRSTAVSTQDALAEFRAGAAEGSDAGDGTSRSSGRQKDEERAGARKQRSHKPARNSGAAVAAPASDTEADAQDPTARSNGDAARGGGTGRTDAARPVVPEEGVYTWNIDGVERGPGVERRLPRRSHRVITHEGNDRWVEHHIFSEQKELWFNLGTAEDGVYLRAARNRVEMGPVTVDRTVTFDPFLYVSRFPMREAQTWDGRWDGPTRGTYSGRTIDHGTLTIGGKTVEVYVTEVEMEMRGEVEGRVLTRSWVAPEYSMVVKQYQETDVQSGPGSYYSEWEGQVVSLTPQR